MQKSIFEQCGGTYTQVGDYLLPDLIIDEAEQQPVDKYGRMRKRYLKEHRPILFSNLLLSGKLDHHLSETDRACADQVADQFEWVRRMNSIRNRAEEIVLNELVYD